MKSVSRYPVLHIIKSSGPRAGGPLSVQMNIHFPLTISATINICMPLATTSCVVLLLTACL